MPANVLTDNTDFICEKRLFELDKELHERYRSSVFAIERLLMNYKTVFPFYTNHSFEHSEQVINYCNIIAGRENVFRMNADELYILLMGACLHDVGMGISVHDIYETKGNIPDVVKYEKEHSFTTQSELARKFHQEFGAQFVIKYARLLEIPEEYVYPICQVIRGHRKTNLFDTKAYSPCFHLQNGGIINLQYISALIKFADELDITADRNLLFDYTKTDKRWSEKQVICYQCHEAIKRLAVVEDCLVLYFSAKNDDIRAKIMETESKVIKTFEEFCKIVELQKDRILVQNSVRFDEE